MAILAVFFALDGPVMAALRPLRDSQFAALIQCTVRWLGTGYVQGPLALFMILVGVIWSRRLMRAAGWTALAFAVSGVASNVLKVLVRRPRPWVSEPPPATWSGYLHNSAFQSFPSAETATTFAVALTIGACYPGLRLPLIVLAVIVGAARVLVGSHHPSDVAGGVLLGTAVAQALIGLARARERRSDAAR